MTDDTVLWLGTESDRRHKDLQTIASYGILWRPGLMFDEMVVSSGEVPVVEEIRILRMESAAKVLVLLTGVVVALGFVRIFSSAERTREAPAYRSLFTENVLASLLWVVTAFRSCSPVPVRKAEEPHRWEMWLQAQPQVSTRGPWRDLTPGTS